MTRGKMSIFSNIKLARENKALKTTVRFLNNTLKQKDTLIEQQQECINQLHADFMRMLKDNTIAVKVSEDGKITEFTKYTRDYFLIDKMGD